MIFKRNDIIQKKYCSTATNYFYLSIFTLHTQLDYSCNIWTNCSDRHVIKPRPVFYRPNQSNEAFYSAVFNDVKHKVKSIYTCIVLVASPLVSRGFTPSF